MRWTTKTSAKPCVKADDATVTAAAMVKCGGGCGCDNCNCATPKQDALFDELDQPIRRFNESYVRELENKLQAALEEAQTQNEAPKCQPSEEQPPEAPQPAKIAKKNLHLMYSLCYKMPGPTWNWNGRSNPSLLIICVRIFLRNTGLTHQA